MSQQLSIFNNAHDFQVGNLIIFNDPSRVEDLIRRLNPILHASHTRNRERSPPNSECFPGTRQEPIQEIIIWADTGVVGPTQAFGVYEVVSTTEPTTHIYWLHGFAGCGKSSISLEIAKIYAESGRLLASYFFSRGAGERGMMNRFAVTLASQLVAAVPATTPLIEAAVRTEPGLVTGDASLATQLDLLILYPFKAVLEKGFLEETLAQGPFVIVIDGLDECEDKRGVEEFIDHILDFFEKYPTIPLRVFIASRVEQHIRTRLETDKVVLGNLDSHSARNDIEKFLQASFQIAAERNRVVKAYIGARGPWPTQSNMDKLVNHIGGSFVLASMIFKYIVHPATEEDSSTPMDRLPLTLKMNGLDTLYAQTLARSQHLHHFNNVISTIALLKRPLAIVEIADLLGIEAFEVLRILLNLQAIIHVPGTDENGGVTLCHTSLRDFLTTQSRSRVFFVPPSFHLHLSYHCFSSILERSNGRAYNYSQGYFDAHCRSFALSDACDLIGEIEQFEARQPLLVNQLPYHAFLCSISFYTLILMEPQPLNGYSDLLTECAKQLALAAECSDRRIRLWLEEELDYDVLDDGPACTVQFTKNTYKTVRQDLQRASTAIQTKFPEILDLRDGPTGQENEFVLRILPNFPTVRARALDSELQFCQDDNRNF
ncbi:hypothetical protein EST38_g9195 [Candolleomyces aberdarensis]|uniref:Nephrocystin 3-like N-terminal domain-containing protein n=1 Tax=Candolleomyces aberdarensis TaxID=2316362 RepID=A0A4V1Q2Y0_9AGAR|nr:hypothetical protein EST38_g9195 [Candolleomyces aberdarensis]